MDIKHVACAMQVKTLGADGMFTGYASVFGEIDSHNEIVAPGAFQRTLTQARAQNRMPAMLWMHDVTQPIGRWMSIREDNNGLLVEGRLALRTQKGAEAYELLKLGALTGLSIGYRLVASRVDKARKARVLTDLELFEISLVTFPANEAARVSDVKSPADARPSVMPDEDQNTPADDEMRAVVARLHRAARTLKSGKK